MNRSILPSLAVGWAGSFAGWMAAAHPILSLVATLLAAVASVYAIVVSMRTARLRRLEIDHATQSICEQCREGVPPRHCPFPPNQRPANCQKP